MQDVRNTLEVFAKYKFDDEWQTVLTSGVMTI